MTPPPVAEAQAATPRPAQPEEDSNPPRPLPCRQAEPEARPGASRQYIPLQVTRICVGLVTACAVAGRPAPATMYSRGARGAVTQEIPPARDGGKRRAFPNPCENRVRCPASTLPLSNPARPSSTHTPHGTHFLPLTALSKHCPRTKSDHQHIHPGTHLSPHLPHPSRPSSKPNHARPKWPPPRAGTEVARPGCGGHRGERIGEAAHPGPPNPDGVTAAEDPFWAAGADPWSAGGGPARSAARPPAPPIPPGRGGGGRWAPLARGGPGPGRPTAAGSAHTGGNPGDPGDGGPAPPSEGPAAPPGAADPADGTGSGTGPPADPLDPPPRGGEPTRPPASPGGTDTGVSAGGPPAPAASPSPPWTGIPEAALPTSHGALPRSARTDSPWATPRGQGLLPVETSCYAAPLMGPARAPPRRGRNRTRIRVSLTRRPWRPSERSGEPLERGRPKCGRRCRPRHGRVRRRRACGPRSKGSAGTWSECTQAARGSRSRAAGSTRPSRPLREGLLELTEPPGRQPPRRHGRQPAHLADAPRPESSSSSWGCATRCWTSSEPGQKDTRKQTRTASLDGAKW